MDLLKRTKKICQLYNIRPSRNKGQNFLIKEEIYDKIVAAAEFKKDDVVLEVGPGLGFLTAKLASRVKKVIAVELDDKLAEILQIGLKARGVENVEVVNQNILDFRFSVLDLKKEFKIQNSKFKNYKIVANLPYNITSIFLRRFLGEAEIKPELMVLMLQKEVAERITAKPGEMSLFAVSVQFYAKPEIIEYVPRENFWPKPEVDSAIIKLKVKSEKLKVIIKASDASKAFEASDALIEKDFFRLVKIGFSARRKMLKNNLANGYHISQEKAERWLENVGFDLKIRAQELAVEDWKKLLVAVSKNML